jgi:hypothetical protein
MPDDVPRVGPYESRRLRTWAGCSRGVSDALSGSISGAGGRTGNITLAGACLLLARLTAVADRAVPRAWKLTATRAENDVALDRHRGRLRRDVAVAGLDPLGDENLKLTVKLLVDQLLEVGAVLVDESSYTLLDRRRRGLGHEVILTPRQRAEAPEIRSVFAEVFARGTHDVLHAKGRLAAVVLGAGLSDRGEVKLLVLVGVLEFVQRVRVRPGARE